MKTPIVNLIKESAPALLIFTLLFLFSFTVAFGQMEARVVIKGQVFTPSGNASITYACLTAGNGEEMEVVIRPNGRFWVNAPENERYTLTFEQHGSYTKQVVVDARHAARSVNRKKDRVIAFDVVLHIDDSDGGQRYDGAVGRIAFHHSNGRMKVNHHYQMVANEDPPPTLVAGEGER